MALFFSHFRATQRPPTTGTKQKKKDSAPSFFASCLVLRVEPRKMPAFSSVAPLYSSLFLTLPCNTKTSDYRHQAKKEGLCAFFFCLVLSFAGRTSENACIFECCTDLMPSFYSILSPVFMLNAYVENSGKSQSNC